MYPVCMVSEMVACRKDKELETGMLEVHCPISFKSCISDIIGSGKKRGISDNRSCKLLISNLHFEVNDADIQELFGQVGEVKKAAVHWDASGRSLGTAEVIYKHAGDAVKACERYNNVPLDGHRLQVTFAQEKLQRAPLSTANRERSKSTSQIRSQVIAERGGLSSQRNQGRYNSSTKSWLHTQVNAQAGRSSHKPQDANKATDRGFSNSRGGSHRRGNHSDKVPTKAELDAQLDSYRKNTDVTSVQYIMQRGYCL